MTILAVVDTVLLVAALIYIVALLRSHADILRRLAVLEDGAATGSGAGRPAVPGPPERPAAIVPAADISGVTPEGDSVALSLGAGSTPTLLAFLSSGCTSCAPLWEELATAELSERVVIVTHGPERESPARIGRLAPDGVELVMAGAAWEDYAVPSTPHFVLTDGAGGIAGRGAAMNWAQLEGMIEDARADAVAATAPRTTAERAARADRALVRAGIGPGHPSLRPTAAARDQDAT